MGSSERDIKELCPNAKVLSGLAILGGSVDRADKDVANWIKKLELIPKGKGELKWKNVN